MSKTAQIIRQYGKTGDTWFGPAPYGERLVVGDLAGRAAGTMRRLAPGSERSILDAAFGSHARQGDPIIHDEMDLPAGAIPAEHDGSLGYYLRVDYADLIWVRLSAGNGRITRYSTRIWVGGGCYLVRHAPDSIEPYGGTCTIETLNRLGTILEARPVKTYTQEEYDHLCSAGQWRGGHVIEDSPPIQPPEVPLASDK